MSSNALCLILLRQSLTLNLESLFAILTPSQIQYPLLFTPYPSAGLTEMYSYATLFNRGVVDPKADSRTCDASPVTH